LDQGIGGNRKGCRNYLDLPIISIGKAVISINLVKLVHFKNLEEVRNKVVWVDRDTKEP